MVPMRAMCWQIQNKTTPKKAFIHINRQLATTLLAIAWQFLLQNVDGWLISAWKFGNEKITTDNVRERWEGADCRRHRRAARRTLATPTTAYPTHTHTPHTIKCHSILCGIATTGDDDDQLPVRAIRHRALAWHACHRAQTSPTDLHSFPYCVFEESWIFIVTSSNSSLKIGRLITL